MKWTDVNDIAIALAEKHEEMDPTYLRFTDLMVLVMDLEGFEDSQARCNEKILETIQAAWLDER